MVKTIILQLHDIFGNIISEDNVLIEEGDILICQIQREAPDLSMVMIQNLKQTIEQVLLNKTHYLILPDYVNLKVMKKKINEN
jgi:hypothetical protein